MTIRRQAAGSPLFTVGLVLAIALAAPSSAAAAGLFDRVGIGTNWGPHWSPSPSVIDARDNQADGAFPAELCLLRNAGFKTIRMYGENSATWISVLDAVDDYNTGKLNCNPGGGVAVDCQTSGNCMSVVYQVGICGPDPRSLAWNGSYTDIGSVKCYEVGKTEADEGKFADSVADELLKLKQVLRAAGDKLAKHVPLVFVGNEILFSRGVCGGGPRPGAACTDDRDCGTGGSCGIAHYCSNALTGSTPSASCSSSATCGAGTCTDVTNLDPLKYAFAQVQQLLSAELPAGSVPAISLSLQVDLVASGSFGDDGSTLMYSRQQLAQALPSKVIAVNTYPDQWGKVTIGQATQCLVPSFPSCVGPSNAVKGQALLAGCVDDPRYRDPRTQKIAHTIDNYVGLLRNVYYPGFDVMIAETGWHTAGTCGAYNDCTATYSPQDAATYYTDLYAYAQTNQVPLLAFQLFDERTKQCDLASGASGEMAEANYGLFSNFCQLKGANAGLVPPAGPGSPGPNLMAFNALLDTDGSGKSCAGQALLGVIGVGNTGVCEHNPTISCNGGYHRADPTHGSPRNERCPPGPNSTDNRCVWGYCASKPTVGCNPDDAGNDPGCGDCRRAGSCAATAQPQPGLYLALLDCAPNQTCGAACWTGQSCNAAKVFGFQCTDQTCGCYAAMTPSTPSLTRGADAVEAPGFVLSYGKGQFEFTKTRTLRPEVFAGDYGIEVHAVWSNAFVGKDWTVTVSAPAGFEELDPPGPCPENTVTSIGGTAANPVINWKSGWTTLCNYPVGGINAVNNLLSLPRGFLSSIPTWPPPVFCLSATGGCGGGTPGPVGFSAASGKAQNVGVATDSGNLRLSGRFTARSALRLDRAAVTVNGLLHEVSGAGELSRRAGGGALLPVTLGARAGSKPTSAIYQTASGVRPSVRVELKIRDARTSAMDFSITVDRDSMPAPTACAGKPSKTQLRTNFIIDDGSDQPLSIDTILPWQCRGNELRLP